MANELYFEKVKTRGRPKVVLNDKGKKTIEDLSTILCTDEEIASILGVSIETLQNKDNLETFLECKKKGNSQGKASLRREQYKLAMKGNCNMLIWLGKQYLGQKDHPDTSDLAVALSNMQTLANIVVHPNKDRKIEDFE